MTQLFTKQSEVEARLSDYEFLGKDKPSSEPSDLVEMIDHLRGVVPMPGGQQVPRYIMSDWRTVFSGMGSMVRAWSVFRNDDKFKRKGSEDLNTTLSQLLIEKHQRYGAGPLMRWGELGVLIRIDSKLARVTNMEALGVSAVDGLETGESIYDTMCDILCYCVLGGAVAQIVHSKKEGLVVPPSAKQNNRIIT